MEKRIVMFIDLTDSTPIAEKLGSKDNFKFIRDFIYYVSIALLENDGRIYQYVGDEIVVSWMYTPQNVHKCFDALELATRLLNRKSSYFQLRYGVIPEFKAGIHAGEVTVGEIGLIKKDIAMSGDTINTAARIRTSCTEYQRKYIASKELLKGVEISWQVESMGFVDLKGKAEQIELFGLNM
ncbi:MAG: adenylate/guanylate cyclase domain-containing protein [Taibaiella sp.]|nr:adenylate/guanylate cyclase domain-containing protein [Taibaiella sp.]